jgi:DNA-binding CsgD family transcriptional regulator
VITPLTISGSNLALVMFENEQIDHFTLREHFFNAYGLTKSESMITHEILSGRSIAEAAKSKSLSPATVRSYMKQVMAKTGTHKQSELISLYFSSILPVNFPQNQDNLLASSRSA